MVKFRSAFGLELDLDQVVGEIVRFIEEDQRYKYKVMVGTDSEQINGSADFVTAVLVHRVGRGGRYFWRRSFNGRFYTLRDRIIQEVMISLEAARQLLEKLKSADTSDWDFEIHADIGAKGDTRVLIQEVVGMIRANNFEARTKPESYAASKVADKHI